MTTITRRLDVCRCGCEGSDSWHARKYERALSNIEPAAGVTTVIAYSAPVAIARQATARLPWGEGRPVRVVEVLMAGRVLGWFATNEVL